MSNITEIQRLLNEEKLICRLKLISLHLMEVLKSRL